MSKQKTNRKTFVFNRRILIFLFAFIVFLCFSINSFKSSDGYLGIAFLVVSLFISLGIFLSPLYYIFTKNEITIVWLVQYKRVIPWASIKSIIELKWGEVNRDLPKYELIYHLNYKGYVVSKQFDLPRNRKVKKVMEMYAKYKIV